MQADSASGRTIGAYLRAAAPLSAVCLVLFAVASHSSSAVGEPLFPIVAMGVLGVALLWALGAPRWTVYAALFALALVANHDRVFVNAQGAHDGASDRDECAEYAAREFLAGRDPWSAPDPKFVPLTVGYSSVLVLSPFVALFGRIDEAASLFWCAILLTLVVADLRRRNGSFLPLCLAYLAGVLELFHTQNWALDELYFPFGFILLAFAVARAGQLGLCGMALAVCVFWRPNYVFVCLGFVSWLMSVRLATSHRAGLLLQLGAGFALGSVAVLTPFVMRSGLGGLGRGPLAVAFGYAAQASWWFLGWHQPSAFTAGLRIVAAGALTWWLGARLRPWVPGHPFWHVLIGGWMAHTIAWHPDDFRDYQLMLVLPTFLAIAFTARREAVDAGLRESGGFG